MLPGKHTTIWSLLITIGIMCFVYVFYTTVMRPARVYPATVNKVLYLDPSFNEEEVSDITAAAEEWKQSTNGIVNYSIRKLKDDNIDYSKSIVVIKITHYFPEVIELDLEGNQVTLGYCSVRGAVPHIALVADRLEDDTFKPVILHELGHSLGLEHNEGAEGIGTLMYPSVAGGSTFITATDLHNFCNLYKCDSSKLHDQEEPLHF